MTIDDLSPITEADDVQIKQEDVADGEHRANAEGESVKYLLFDSASSLFADADHRRMLLVLLSHRRGLLGFRFLPTDRIFQRDVLLR